MDVSAELFTAGPRDDAGEDRFVRRPITLEAWHALDEDDEGEVVDGWLVEEEAPSELHEGVVAWLVAMLWNWGHPRGARVRASESKLTMPDTRGRKPDALVWLPGQRRPPARGPVTVPPSVVIEVVTPTRRDEARDRAEKFVEYAAFGVPYYWIVDPAIRTVEIYERQGDGRYVRAATGTTGTLAAVPGCDGLRLELDALWAECDEIERSGGPPG